MLKKTSTPYVAVVVAFIGIAGPVSAQMHDRGSHEMPMTSKEPSQATAQYSAPMNFKAQLQKVYAAYFSVQTALSRDLLQDAKKGAAEIQGALKKVDMNLLQGKAHVRWMEHSGVIGESGKAIAGAKNIDAAREEFRNLSNALILTAREFGVFDPGPVYVLHCPMAFNKTGADWLQKQPETANPYFGKSMPACGQIIETLSKGKI